METKDIQYKASVDPVQGIISGYAAVYGNRDLGNDRILAGAGRKTIAERLGKIKLCWNHDLDDAWGKMLRLEEVPRSQLPAEVLAAAPGATGGLYMEAKVALTPTGLERLALVAEGIKDGLSIGYDAVDHEFKSESGTRVREIKEYKLYEISNVTLGMNEGALVSGVKSQAGRRLSRKASGETFTYTMQRLQDALSDAYPYRGSGYAAYAGPMMADDDDDDGPGCTIQDIYTDAVIVCDQDWDAYWEIPYSMAANGTVTLGTPALVKISYTAVPPGGPEGMEQMGTTFSRTERKAPIAERIAKKWAHVATDADYNRLSDSDKFALHYDLAAVGVVSA